MDNDIYPTAELEDRVDTRSEELDFSSFDSAVYRLGFTALAVAGATDTLKVGDVELRCGPGPVRTQKTSIQQRTGIELVFDKAMNVHLEVGAGQWLTVAHVHIDDPKAIEPSVGIRAWRARARSAIGLACLVLDDRLAIEELFEDIVLFRDQEAIAVADQVDLLRNYLPYEVTETEHRAFQQLASVDLDEKADPAVRAARWYLRAVELGPTPEAVIFFWCALEAFAPERMTKEKAIIHLLHEADWNPDLLDAPPRELVQLRADIVHKGLDDPERLQESVYRLETVIRVILRHYLGLTSSWPEAPAAQLFTGDAAERISESWTGPPAVEWHDSLPTPDPAETLGVEWIPIDAREWDGHPLEVTLVGHLEPGWGHRLRGIVQGVTRSLGLEAELPEITVAAANRTGVPQTMDIACNREEIVVRPRVMREPDEIRLPFLAWLLQDVVMQHALIRRGVDPGHPFGLVLLQLAGAWAQQQFMIENELPDEDPFELDSFTGELEAEENLVRFGRALGAAIAGNRKALARFDEVHEPAGLNYAGMLAAWRGVESTSDLLDRAADAYAALESASE